MSAKRPAINRDLLEGLERQLSDAMSKVSDDDPLAELARLIEEDPFADDIASTRTEPPRVRVADPAAPAPDPVRQQPPGDFGRDGFARPLHEVPRSDFRPEPEPSVGHDPLSGLQTSDAVAEELRRGQADKPQDVAVTDDAFDYDDRYGTASQPEATSNMSADDGVFLDPGRLARDVEAAIGLPDAEPSGDELRFDMAPQEPAPRLFEDEATSDAPELEDPFAARVPEPTDGGWGIDEPATSRRGAVWDDPVFDDAATDPRFDDIDPFAAPADDIYADRDGGQVADRFSGESRMRGLIIVVAVIGFVVVGAVVAFAYRSFFGGADGTPPTVAADTTPDKVEPDQPASAEQPETGKLVYDRLNGDESTSAEVVSEGEGQGSDTNGRVVRIIEPAAPPAEGEDVAAANGDEPRRVRTVVVRPDGTVIAGGDDAATGSQSATVPEPPTTVSTQQQTGTESATVSEPVVTGTATESTNTATQATSPVPLPPAPRQVETVAVASTNQQSAAADEQATTAQPATGQPAPSQPVATAALPSGAFLVQVAATREEGQAQATANSVQQRFAGIIGGYQPTVQRADLGSRGIFYRVAVGPMSSQQEAAQVCDRLKSAGLDCFVRRN